MTHDYKFSRNQRFFKVKYYLMITNIIYRSQIIHLLVIITQIIDHIKFIPLYHHHHYLLFSQQRYRQRTMQVLPNVGKHNSKSYHLHGGGGDQCHGNRQWQVIMGGNCGRASVIVTWELIIKIIIIINRVRG